MAEKPGLGAAASSSSPMSPPDDDFKPNFLPKLPPRAAKKAAAATRPAAAGVAPSASSSSSTNTGLNGPAAAGSDSASLAAASVPAGAAANGTARGLPSLPPRAHSAVPSAAAAPPSAAPVEEDPAIQKLRQQFHEIRVQLLRAAGRLGFTPEHQMVKQVLYRLQLAEKIHARDAKLVRARRPAEAAVPAASRDAQQRDQQHGPSSRLGLTINILLIGPSATGKTQLAHRLLGCQPPKARLDAGAGALDTATKRVNLVTGTVHGLDMVLIDTPGFRSSAAEVSYNNRVLQQIRTAFRRHKPDLLLYVNRFDDIGIPVGELPVLKGLSRLLGPSVWLNTLVALTHATSPLPAVTLKMRDGSMATHVLPFEQFATKRAHILQTVIREASADQRLMNPMVYVDTAPGAYDPSEVQGQGRSHPTWGAMEQLLLMVVAAKLLADTEVLVQAQSSQRREAGAAAAAAGGGPSGASLLQQMYGPAQLPIPYLLQSAIQAVQPVRYPEHDVVMGVLGAKQELLLMKDDPHQARALARQINNQVLAMKQAKRQLLMQQEIAADTLAGGKFITETPSTSLYTRMAQCPQPSHRYRYQMLEAGKGWITKPHIEPHGIDGTDGVEGLIIEKTGVASSSGGGSGSGGDGDAGSGGAIEERQLLGGVPYRHEVMASCGKDQAMVNVRSEATLWHAPEGAKTGWRGSGSSLLAADVQGAVTPDTQSTLMTFKADHIRTGLLSASHKLGLGLHVSRPLQGSGLLQRGQNCACLRLQDTFRTSLARDVPLEVSSCLARMLPRDWAEQDGGWAASVEAGAQLRQALHTRFSVPLQANANIVSHNGERRWGLGSRLQVRTAPQDVWACQATFQSSGQLGLSLMMSSSGTPWLPALAALVPLVNLVWGRISEAREIRKDAAAAVDPDAGE